MFRVSLANATAKRTCKPLHERHQATPLGTYLNANETGDVYSGMVVSKTGPDAVSLCDGAADAPFGLAALDSNPVINDLDGMDLRLFAVWQGGPDAYFLVDAPAIDTGETFATATDGTAVPLYAGTGASLGLITPTASGTGDIPVAELIEVVSDTRILIRLQAPAALPLSA